jgi:hypothetical protein
MWSRRKPSSNGQANQPGEAGESADLDPISLLEWYFPAAIEEHPAKRRIRRSNEIAYEMRQNAGRHKVATD